MSATASPPPDAAALAEMSDEAFFVAWRVTKDPFTRFRERLRGNFQVPAGLVILGGFVVLGVAALVRYGDSLELLNGDPQFQQSGVTPPGPTWGHPFGVMSTLGLDIASSLLRATPIDLALVGGSILLAVGLGLLLGSLAALFGGAVDFAVTGVTDVVVSVPPFFFVMVLFLGLQPFVLSPSFLLLFGGLYAAVLWPYHARPVRARALQVVGEPYVESAKASGATPGRILQRHVIPNSVFPLLAQVPVDVYNFLFVLTVFPFLGCFGGGAGGFFNDITPLPRSVYPEWGFLLANGACYGWSPLPELNHWWMYGFPALTVVVFGLGVALLCDGAERLLSTVRRGT